MNNNPVKLEIYGKHKIDEKLTTKSKAVTDQEVINEDYLDEKFSKKEGLSSFLEKDYNEFKLHNKVDLLIERAVRTTIQTFYDKTVFKNYDIADQLIKK